MFIKWCMSRCYLCLLLIYWWWDFFILFKKLFLIFCDKMYYSSVNCLFLSKTTAEFSFYLCLFAGKWLMFILSDKGHFWRTYLGIPRPASFRYTQRYLQHVAMRPLATVNVVACYDCSEVERWRVMYLKWFWTISTRGLAARLREYLLHCSLTIHSSKADVSSRFTISAISFSFDSIGNVSDSNHADDQGSRGPRKSFSFLKAKSRLTHNIRFWKYLKKF